MECCGHLSVFKVNGDHYYSQPNNEYGDEGMDIAIENAFYPGMKCVYEYDFGSTTKLKIKAQPKFILAKNKDSIQLLARNNPLQMKCCNCDNVATLFCLDYLNEEDDAWFCADCAPKHKCGTLPIPNSPRLGACGYTG